MKIRTFIGLAPAIAVALSASGLAGAGTIIDVPTEQPTIQAGIDAAVNGDRVRVAPGTYHETIDFLGKSITVHSSDGAAVTIIDASTVPDPGTGVPVVRFVNEELRESVLQGFTITGGTGDTDLFGPGNFVGGGIVISGSAPTILGCVITGNSAALGAGGFVTSGFPLLSDCTFDSNDAQLNSDGIGGGLYLFFGAATITDCAFTGNTAQERSAAIAIDRTDNEVRITRTTFTGNTSPGPDGGCIEADINAGLVIEECRFDNNSAQSGRGGALRVVDGDVTILNSVFAGNRVNQVGGFGGALHLSGDTALIANCLFHGNGAQLQGGAILADNIDIDIVNCTFAENDSKDGSAVFIRRDSGSSALLTNNIFWDNFGALDQIGTTFSGGPLTVDHSIVQGGWAGAGSGNSAADPLFADPSGGDYAILPGSPAIDAGDTPAAAAVLTTAVDVGGTARLVDDPASADTGVAILGATIDIGAFEAQPADEPACLADLNDDGILDLADIGLFVSAFTAGCP